MTAPARVLVVSPEPVGRAMAGPAIRAWELARALAERFTVTLAAPPASEPPDPAGAPSGLELLEADVREFHALARACERHDVVVAQRLPAQLLRHCGRSPARLVVDLYNPLVVEVLEAAAGETPARARRTGRIVTAGVRAHLAAADFVLCASERQRDLWVGAMALHGLLDPALYRADPTLRGLIDVVPFGIPDGPPPAASREGRWPAVGRGDRVLLWGGGIWRWLDALTPIRAMERIRRERDDVHLVFLGTGRPLEARGASVAAEAATEARRLGLLGERVHVEDGWVPYAERGPLLAAADIGVSAHHDHLESRYAFRTRLTDYMWAGLPVVTSSGDALGELVARRGLGAAVAPGDVEGFAAACLALLADEGRYERAAAASAAAGRELRWSEVTRPLQRFCLDPERRRAPVRGSLARESLGQQAWIAVDLLARLGSREVGRRARWAAGRTVRRLASRGRRPT